jgi:cytochrome c peroxidase
VKLSAIHIVPFILTAVYCAADEPRIEPNPDLTDLGRHLFFEPRLSGDGSISCASCHDLDVHGSDGLPLSKGYPGTLYFRRTPSIYNAAQKPRFYWDGRLSGQDIPALVRDHISEAHFMQADGRLILERLRQIPFYESTFTDATGRAPSYGGILKAISAFVETLRVDNAPFDRFSKGDKSALNGEEIAGWELFNGKAGCVRCHSGPSLSDWSYHNTGVPTNPNLFQEPLRHITFRRFMKTFGVSDYRSRTHDAGLEIITHESDSDGGFFTPSLRNLNDQGPYMHNGMMRTLEDVVAHYNNGNEKSSELKSINLDQEETLTLVAFLKSLKGTPNPITVPDPKEYEERELGKN